LLTIQGGSKLLWVLGRILLTVAGEKHPADEIGRALSQASGILASLSNCYDETQKNFEIAQPFVSEALKAIESILAKANVSLSTLYENYDLTPSVKIEQAIVEVQPEEPEPEPVNLGYFGRIQAASRFANADENEEDTQFTAEDMVEQPAQSYEELYEKLTAMSNAAAGSEGESRRLLPVLESLRQDIERIRNSA
jgi:hypothetical protein